MRCMNLLLTLTYVCNGRVSVRPSVCLSRRPTAAVTWFAAYRLLIDVCCLPQLGRRQQISMHSCRCQSLSSGQRQFCDPRRIAADLFWPFSRGIGISMSMSVFVSVCMRAYLQNCTSNLRQIFMRVTVPCFGPPQAVLRYVTYFLFYG